MNLASVRLITDDVARLVVFYERVTGVGAWWANDDFAELRTTSGTLVGNRVFERYGAPLTAAAPPSSPPPRADAEPVSVRARYGPPMANRTADVGTSTTPEHDVKPRTRDVTDGIEATASAACCARSAWATTTGPSRRSASRRAGTRSPPATSRSTASRRRPRRACTHAGGYPLEFGTISVSDGISMGHEGMHFSLVSREVIADSVETVMQAERLDGSVLLAGCDKSLPGMLMAAARLDLASVFLYAGSIAARAQRRRHERTSRSSTRSRRSAPCRRGQMTARGRRRDRVRDLPGRGRLRRHVHRQHDGLRSAEALGHVAARLRRPARRADRRRDGFAAPLRRGRRRAAAAAASPPATS